MKRSILWKYFVLFLFLLLQYRHLSAQNASRNDHIFPASPEAKAFIDFDSRGFLVNGKRTFIVSAGMEYARVPSGLWRDRLLRLKRAGFNAVEMYTFWNFHEPKEGQFNFSGDHNLDAFLKLLKEMDMYAIVRVGPYYCGEWSLGGYPVWLKFKPGLRVREDNPAFLKAVDNFFDKLIPIVAKNQVSRGGSVILVQLENEHPAGWGDLVPNNYFRHLIDKVVSLGIRVPYYFSGLHPGNDPAGNAQSLDDPGRPNPWFSAEFWSVWFSNYGPQPQDSTIYDRRVWKIIAHGGNGYNVYMAHGGSNFDYNNDRDMAASYDYGAAVGQGGDLRPIYYTFKRAAWFARSFQDILANSSDAGSEISSSSSNPAVKVTARSGPAGTIVFLDNPGSDHAETLIQPPKNIPVSASPKIDLATGEIMPIVQNYSLTGTVKLAWAPTRIYAIIPQGNTISLLTYGKPNSPVALYFNVPSGTKVTKGQQNFKELSNRILEFSEKIPLSGSSESIFEADGYKIRIITVNETLAQRSWIIDSGGQNVLVTGPEFAAETTMKNNQLNVVTERPWESSNDPVWAFKPAGEPVQLTAISRTGSHPVSLSLQPWKVRDASAPALPDYNDKSWKTSDEPLQMGADGDISANAWYRTKLQVPETGKYTLQFKNLRDRAALFLDGKKIDIVNRSVDLDLKRDMLHTLAIFTAHSGRNKQLFYVGQLDSADAKGISGEVTLRKSDGSGNIMHVGEWKIKGGPGDPNSKTGWRTEDGRPETEDGRPKFFRTEFTLPALEGTTVVWRVVTAGLSYGSVWVNGHNLGRYPEKIKINGLYIPENWLKKGKNTLVIYDENGVYPEKVSIQAESAASRDVLIFN